MTLNDLMKYSMTL